MSDKQFRFDMGGVKRADTAMKDALAKATYVLQGEIRDEQVIPRDVGTLQGEGFTIIDQSRSKYMDMAFTTPYARRLYFHPEYNFRTDENPNAQGLWMRHWLKGGKYEDRLSEIFEGLLKL